MIPVAATLPPVGFDATCRQPGLQWLAAHPPGGEDQLPNDWRKFLPDLCVAFHNRCGYLAMLDLNGTVDHFLSTHNQRHLAYEWSNYRYATGWLNSSKQNVDQRVLDPFQVREEWFERPTTFAPGREPVGVQTGNSQHLQHDRVAGDRTRQSMAAGGPLACRRTGSQCPVSAPVRLEER